MTAQPAFLREDPLPALGGRLVDLADPRDGLTVTAG